MMAFVLADLRDWRDRRMAKTIAEAALILFLAGFVGPLNPVFLALSCAAAFLVSGWAEGYRYQSEQVLIRLLLTFPRRPGQLAVGKALSLSMIWLTLVFVFSPVLAASAFAWGTSLPFIGASLLCSTVVFFVAGSAGFLSRFFVKEGGRPLGFFLLMVWTVTSFFVDEVRMVNPFFQILELSEHEGSPGVLIGTGIEAIVASSLFALSALAIARSRRSRHD